MPQVGEQPCHFGDQWGQYIPINYSMTIIKRIRHAETGTIRLDLLSHMLDRDDWSIHSAVFQELDHLWGPHTIDRSTNYINTQLPRFNSHLGSEEMDAFTCDWSGENNWLCPPPKSD